MLFAERFCRTGCIPCTRTRVLAPPILISRQVIRRDQRCCISAAFCSQTNVYWRARLSQVYRSREECITTLNIEDNSRCWLIEVLIWYLKNYILSTIWCMHSKIFFFNEPFKCLIVDFNIREIISRPLLMLNKYFRTISNLSLTTVRTV